MKTSLYEEFKKAEKLGVDYVRDLYCVVFREAIVDKDFSKINELFDVIHAREIFATKEIQKFYDSVMPNFMRD